MTNIAFSLRKPFKQLRTNTSLLPCWSYCKLTDISFTECKGTIASSWCWPQGIAMGTRGSRTEVWEGMSRPSCSCFIAAFHFSVLFSTILTTAFVILTCWWCMILMLGREDDACGRIGVNIYSSPKSSNCWYLREGDKLRRTDLMCWCLL